MSVRPPKKTPRTWLQVEEFGGLGEADTEEEEEEEERV